MEFHSLEQIFEQQIEGLYDAEKKLLLALPKMADAARDSRLKTVFREHLSQTESHVQRLVRVFNYLGKNPLGQSCRAMNELIDQAEELLSADGNDGACDAALIAAAQRIEHYEIAGYRTAANLAQRLGMHEAARLLQDTLEQEKSADKRLTELADESIILRPTDE